MKWRRRRGRAGRTFNRRGGVAELPTSVFDLPIRYLSDPNAANGEDARMDKVWCCDADWCKVWTGLMLVKGTG